MVRRRVRACAASIRLSCMARDRVHRIQSCTRRAIHVCSAMDNKVHAFHVYVSQLPSPTRDGEDTLILYSKSIYTRYESFCLVRAARGPFSLHLPVRLRHVPHRRVKSIRFRIPCHIPWPIAIHTKHHRNIHPHQPLPYVKHLQLALTSMSRVVNCFHSLALS